jgi:hypothetical protein
VEADLYYQQLQLEGRMLRCSINWLKKVPVGMFNRVVIQRQAIHQFKRNPVLGVIQTDNVVLSFILQELSLR